MNHLAAQTVFAPRWSHEVQKRRSHSSLQREYGRDVMEQYSAIQPL